MSTAPHRSLHHLISLALIALGLIEAAFGSYKIIAQAWPMVIVLYLIAYADVWLAGPRAIITALRAYRASAAGTPWLARPLWVDAVRREMGRASAEESGAAQERGEELMRHWEAQSILRCREAVALMTREPRGARVLAKAGRMLERGDRERAEKLLRDAWNNRASEPACGERARVLLSALIGIRGRAR